MSTDDTEHATYCDACGSMECVHCHDFNGTATEVADHAVTCPDRPRVTCPRFGECLDVEHCQQGGSCVAAVALDAVRADDDMLTAASEGRVTEGDPVAPVFVAWRETILRVPDRELVSTDDALVILNHARAERRPWRRVRRHVRRWLAWRLTRRDR